MRTTLPRHTCRVGITVGRARSPPAKFQIPGKQVSVPPHRFTSEYSELACVSKRPGMSGLWSSASTPPLRTGFAVKARPTRQERLPVWHRASASGPKKQGTSVSTDANRTMGSLIGLICLTCLPSPAADQRPRPAPLLIQKQSVEIQASWREVDAIIYDNGRLKQPLPDPYFARGDLWAAAGGHEDALRDYLTGTTLLLGGEPSLVERAEALERLAAGLSRLHARPKPDYPIDAEKAFHRGFAYYRAGRFVEAEGLWADAVRFSPDNAGFRAHHGLALRQLGQNLEAEREVAVVRSALCRDDDSGSERNAFYRQMARIQGPERWWLEARIRIPNADQTLVDEARQLLTKRASPKPRRPGSSS